MSHRSHPLFPLLATVFLFAACEKTIDFDGELTDPLPVMVSQPETDSLWQVRLSWSRFFLGNSTIATIDYATVSVEVNGIVLGTATPQGDGMYATGVTPHAGDTLTLRATVPGHGLLTAGCRMPHAPQASLLKVEYDTTVTQYYDYETDAPIYDTSGEATAYVELQDAAKTQDYYMVRLKTHYDWGDEYLYFGIDDNVLFEESAGDDLFGMDDDGSYGNRVFFDDSRINGQRHLLKIYYNYTQDPLQYILEIYTLSRELYLYLQSVAKAREDDGLGGIVSEPVQVQCNVVGGIGVVGGMNRTVLPLTLK